MAWSDFVGNSGASTRTKIYFAKSTDCGKSLDGTPTKLSEGYPLGQGTAIAVHPANPNIIYVAWRQVAIDGLADAIFIVKSTDGGKTFTKPRPVTGPTYRPFDQPTTSTTFRTTAYPTMVMDETGRLYLAYSERVGPNREGFVPTDDPAGGARVELPTARILVTTTLDGSKWETPFLVDALGADADGHQFMPALAYAAGRLNLTWYDFRYDESNAFNAYADEKDVIGIPDGVRHTLDIRAAQSEAGWPLAFTVYGVSDLLDPKQKVSLYHAQKKADPSPPGKQLNFNRGNLKLYSGGTKPFMGDYIGTAGVQWMPDGTGGWVFNGRNVDKSNTVLRTFQTAWADNRDAITGYSSETNPDLAYVKPRTDPAQACSAGSDAYKLMNSRNANVYTSRITPGLYLSALGNTKPTDSIERAFAINLENGTENEMTVHLSIGSDVPASFTQPSGTDVRSIDVTVGKFSSTARTVYVGPTPGVMYPPHQGHGDERQRPSSRDPPERRSEQPAHPAARQHSGTGRREPPQGYPQPAGAGSPGAGPPGAGSPGAGSPGAGSPSAGGAGGRAAGAGSAGAG